MTMLSQNVNQFGAMEAQQDIPQEEQQPGVNVGNTERLLTGAVGGVLLLTALRRSLPSLMAAGIGGMLVYRAVSGHCSAYEAMGIDTAHEDQDQNGAAPEEYFNRGIHVAESYVVQKSPEELYNFWKNFENLPRFMRNLESVTKIDETRSHWVAVGPAGYRVEWDAEIINDEPNKLIAWRSLGADVDNAGSVRFIEGVRNGGTEVKVTIDYIPPGGNVGWAVAKLFGRTPEDEICEDLGRFKHVMETGANA
jgi:uncharacterized membrane protein